MIVATTTQIHGKTAEVTGVGVTAKAVVPPVANRGSLMLVIVAVIVFAEVLTRLFNAT